MDRYVWIPAASMLASTASGHAARELGGLIEYPPLGPGGYCDVSGGGQRTACVARSRQGVTSGCLLVPVGGASPPYSSRSPRPERTLRDMGVTT